MSLYAWGWSDSLAQASAAAPDLEPARVLSIERELYAVATASGETEAELSGRLRYTAVTAEDLPAVGDWVLLRAGRVIDGVLPRRTLLARKDPGSRGAAQVLAANIDLLLITAGLDGDFNLRRLERYHLLALEAGATPVFVLNKADVHPDPAAAAAAVRAIAPGAAVVLLSALRQQGLEQLEPFLRPGVTAALLGSSGAGKSTLVNALLGAPVQPMLAVRAHDSRGRHATTRRQLFPLPGGALLLDQPGIRELGLLSGEDSLGQAFADIAELARGCRYADCGHTNEPGCAVRDAAAPERLAAFRKLQRELAYQARESDYFLAQKEKRKWKAIHKSMRQFYK